MKQAIFTKIQPFFKNILLLHVFSLFYGCIPIEDKINPEVSLENLLPVYHYQDTIRFSLILFDNSNMDSASISIQKFDQMVSEQLPWSYADSFKVEGRRVEPFFEIAVPEYKQTGTYLLTAYGFDDGGNVDTVQRFFNLEADAKAPLFHELNLDLPQNEAGQYLACRSEVLRLGGGTSDNLRVTKVGYSLGETAENLVVVSGDSISLGNLLSGNIRIPNNTPDGSLLNFTLVAVDTFANRSTFTFPVLVSCDDEAPVLTYTASSPMLNNNLVAKVQKGQTLKLTEFMVRDNRFISTVELFFNQKGKALQSILQLSPEAPTFDLAQAFPSGFTVPADAFTGGIYEVNITATDSVGNQSIFFRAELHVVENLPPRLIVTDTYRNGQRLNFSETQPIPVKKGDFLTFDGKIDEDFELEKLSYYWYEATNEPVLKREINSFESYPVDLRKTYPNTLFRVPVNAATGSEWVLTITAQDSQNTPVSVNYLFVVE